MEGPVNANRNAAEAPVQEAQALASRGHGPVSFIVFVTILAGLMATNALATDIMLPAFPEIAEALGTTSTNVQALITAYLLGFGISQFFIGFLADRFGRWPVLMVGLMIYTIMAFASAGSDDLTTILVIRFIQGMSAGAPRVIVSAAVRDCYSGRQMARVMSLVMTIFLAIPLVAPAVGQVILLVSNWHWVLGALGIYGIVMILACWFWFPETLDPANRRELRPSVIMESLAMIFGSRQTIGYTLASGVFFGSLFGYIAQAQQLIGEAYGLGVWFPAIFALMVGGLTVATLVNAALVERLGQRYLSHWAIVGFTLLSAIMLVVGLAGRLDFITYCILQTLTMGVVGLVFANINSLALEPHGRIAGVASSFVSAFSIIIGSLTGYLIGKSFDGTAIPLATGYLVAGLGTIALIFWTERGRMFGRV